MSSNNLKKTIIEREVEEKLIWITVSKYSLFMSYGKIGIDAKSLYEHYQFTAILQKTNSVWALDSYCRKGLDWGRDRFEKAKNLLRDLDLVEETQIRDDKGQFMAKYVKVRTKTVELEPSRLSENPQVGKPDIGKTTTNALTNNINALTNNKNALTSISKDILTTFQVDTSGNDSLKKTLPVEKEPSRILNKELCPIKNSDMLNKDKINKFVEYWNSKKNLTHHRPGTQTYGNAAKLFRLFTAGRFAKVYDISPDYMAKNKILAADLSRKWTEAEIYEAIDRYDKLLGGEYGTIYADKLTTKCETFLYNSMSKTSIFLTKAGVGREPRASKEKIADQGVYNLYKKELGIVNMNPVEEVELIRCVNFVCKRAEEYREKVGQYSVPGNFRGNIFFKTHIAFLRERYFDKGVFNITQIGNQNNWKKYIVWVKAARGREYDLEPDKKTIESMRRNHEKKASEAGIIAENKRKEEKELQGQRDEWEEKKRGWTGKEGIRGRCLAVQV